MAQIKTFTEARISDHQHVAKGTYDRPEVLDTRHIHWKHLDNPSGPSDAIEIYEKKNKMNLIGRAFLMPREFILADGSSIAGATVTDLVVKPEYRSAARLIDLVKSVKSFSNAKFVIHSSNEVSDIFYRKMFKFPVHFSLSSSGCPVRIKSLLCSRKVPGAIAAFANFLFTPARWSMQSTRYILGCITGMRFGDMPSGDTLHTIHSMHHKRTGPQFRRNADFVEWRYRSGSISKSELYGLYNRKKECFGYIAVRKTEVNNLSFLILMDLVISYPLTKIEYFWLKVALMSLTVRSGADIAFVMYNDGHPELAPFGNLPFIRIPDSVLPHSTPIFSHRHASVAEIKNIDQLYFTLADLDYF